MVTLIKTMVGKSWNFIGFILLMISFLVAFSGGLYAGNESPMSTNITGAISLLLGPKSNLYFTHLLTAFTLLAIGAWYLSWNACESFTNIETGVVYHKPSPLLMTETFTGGVGRLNQKDPFKSIKTN